jgi:hypothetical protein
MDVGALITLLLPLFFEKINPHTQKAIRENLQKQYELSQITMGITCTFFDDTIITDVAPFSLSLSLSLCDNNHTNTDLNTGHKHQIQHRHIDTDNNLKK